MQNSYSVNFCLVHSFQCCAYTIKQHFSSARCYLGQWQGVTCRPLIKFHSLLRWKNRQKNGFRWGGSRVQKSEAVCAKDCELMNADIKTSIPELFLSRSFIHPFLVSEGRRYDHINSATSISLSEKQIFPLQNCRLFCLRWVIRAETPISWNCDIGTKTWAETALSCFWGVKGVSSDAIDRVK